MVTFLKFTGVLIWSGFCVGLGQYMFKKTADHSEAHIFSKKLEKAQANLRKTATL